MAKVSKARVFHERPEARRSASRRSIALTAEEVYVRRDPQSGDLILSQAPGGWDEIFAALDAAGIPEDFLADRKQGPPARAARFVILYLIDTNIVSYMLTGKSRAGQGEAEEPARQTKVACVSTVTEGRTTVWLGQEPAFSNSHRVRRFPKTDLRVLPLGAG